jgi:hypothetical protein
MVTALMHWDGKQNVVIINDGKSTILIPLDQFLALPAVRYVMELAIERADLGLQPEEPLPALN